MLLRLSLLPRPDASPSLVRMTIVYQYEETTVTGRSTASAT